MDAPSSSHMFDHNGELRILSVYGKGEGPLEEDGHDTLFTVSELESLSSLSANKRLVHSEELTGPRAVTRAGPVSCVARFFQTMPR